MTTSHSWAGLKTWRQNCSMVAFDSLVHVVRNKIYRNAVFVSWWTQKHLTIFLLWVIFFQCENIYSRTPIILTMIIWIADYPSRLQRKKNCITKCSNIMSRMIRSRPQHCFSKLQFKWLYKTLVVVTAWDNQADSGLFLPRSCAVCLLYTCICLFTKSVHCHRGIDLHISVLEC